MSGKYSLCKSLVLTQGYAKMSVQYNTLWNMSTFSVLLMDKHCDVHMQMCTSAARMLYAWLHVPLAVPGILRMWRGMLCVWTWCHRWTVSLHMQVQEMFGSGTACVVCPVEEIQYLDEVLALYCTVPYCRPLHCFDHWCVVCAFVYTVCVGCACTHMNEASHSIWRCSGMASGCIIRVVGSLVFWHRVHTRAR